MKSLLLNTLPSFLVVIHNKEEDYLGVISLGLLLGDEILQNYLGGTFFGCWTCAL